MGTMEKVFVGEIGKVDTSIDCTLGCRDKAATQIKLNIGNGFTNSENSINLFLCQDCLLGLKKKLGSFINEIAFF